MASRYHCLPSEILTGADTFDIWILNTVVEYQNQQQAKESGQKPIPKLSQEQMKAMIERTRNQQ